MIHNESSTKAVATREAVLASTGLFPGLDKDQLAAIAREMQLMTFDKDQVIVAEGEPADHLYILTSGKADVLKRVDLASESVRLISLGPGEYLGESILDGGLINATIVATVDGTQALRLDAASFKVILDNHSEVAASLLRGLSKELRAFRSVLTRTLSITGKSTPAATSNVIRMAVFDFMKHEKQSFEACVDAFSESLDENTSFEVQYFESKLDTKTVRLAAGCQVVCIFVNDTANAEVLTHLAAQGVKLLTLRCAGFDMVDLKAASALGIAVTRVPAYSPYAVAEFAVTLALSLNRKIVPASARVRQGNFSLAGLVGFDLYGKTVGVIGTGKIGQCFIKIMLGFGCKVLCYDAYPSKDVASWENCSYVTLDELLNQSKLISLHAPLLPETKHMINAASLAKMQKGAVLINTSRGGLVDTQALIQALKSGHISGAGLDVYENEKSLFFEDHSLTIMEDDSYVRLMSFPNVIVTGHQAFLTEEALDKIGSTTMENVRQFMVERRVGKSLENVVL
ncbi:hypothetical protein CcCBS67573_g01904 [Chytriomyces confervae]|uniref:Cyclic nucleotide-binding domain-containing protein n=1 Tax=Chytriomyces confervae TaxID=246404 RepID=A0A507FMH3_9FUNG|nr:hypothetical protein HDU80_003280 [Chytriomyces hyalinus]TPX76825.1 hypothetical protein CcCBS67573_g01904 [Chytriomyces confervae]